MCQCQGGWSNKWKLKGYPNTSSSQGLQMKMLMHLKLVKTQKILEMPVYLRIISLSNSMTRLRHGKSTWTILSISMQCNQCLHRKKLITALLIIEYYKSVQFQTEWAQFVIVAISIIALKNYLIFQSQCLKMYSIIIWKINLEIELMILQTINF